MSFAELLRMAVHNLWRRKARTLLNLLGVVVGGIVLLMTAAGGGGVREAVQGLFDSSPYARQIEIMPSHNSDLTPPESVLQVTAAMSPERKERIQEAIKQQWQSEQEDSADSHSIPAATVAALERTPHVKQVVPDTFFQGQVTIGQQSRTAMAFGMGPHDPDLPTQIVAGEPLREGDREGVLVHEFLAYQMGFQSDQQLQQLIGMPIEFAYRRTGGNLHYLLQRVTSAETEFAEQTRFVAAVVQLIQELDATRLSEEQKQLIRQAFEDFGGISSALKRSPADGIGPGDPAAGAADRVLTRRLLVVRGVFRSVDYNNAFSLFRQYIGGGHGDVALPHHLANEIYLTNPRNDAFYHLTAVVESTRHLAEVVAAAEEHDCSTFSALPILETVDYQIQRASWLFYGLAGVILLVAAIGISNTLIISVLERTPELGIMKSLGARDSQVMLLMMCEGALLGAAGAAAAVSISKLLALLGQRLLRSYVEGRLHAELAGQLFQFRLPMVLLVAGICIVLCMAASLLPAWRAARLDPVIAMRRS